MSETFTTVENPGEQIGTHLFMPTRAWDKLYNRIDEDICLMLHRSEGGTFHLVMQDSDTHKVRFVKVYRLADDWSAKYMDE